MSKDTNKEAVIKAAFTDVNKFGQNGEFDKAIKAVNRILGVAPDDTTALHCKVVCLIHLSKFEEALRFIEKNKLNDLVFEKSYCLYRLNKPSIALELIDSVGSELSPNLMELRTQVLYRLERFNECFESYKEIIKNTSDEYENERRTNLSAVAANLALNEDKSLPNIPNEETYEQFFNSACLLANRKQYAEAEQKLRISEKLCRETFEEDGATEEDIVEEVDVIRVQLAFCLQMQGKQKEAMNIYAEVLRNKSKDPALMAVASNNSVVINKDQNVFDSKKKIRAALAEACESKLNTLQKEAIALNNCLLTLFTNSHDQIQQMCSKMSQNYPKLAFQAFMIRCAQLAKDKKHKEAIELLQRNLSNLDDYAFETKFAIVQLQLHQGDPKGAIQTLLSLGEAKYKPGIVSALVTLYLGADDKAAASDILKSAVNWYKKHKVGSSNLSDMWRKAAEFHLRGGASETAASSLEELLKINPNDKKVLAQLVIAYAQYDVSRAMEVSKKLPKLQTLTTASEIDTLESANWIMSAKMAKRTGAGGKGELSPGTPALQKPRRNTRKRKGKLPQNYNADVAPDPERWLPKHERTGFRKKRDRRAKDIIKGSQGMSTGASDQYDMSNRANLVKNSPATSLYQEPALGPRQQHRKGGHKKKKGRF